MDYTNFKISPKGFQSYNKLFFLVPWHKLNCFQRTLPYIKQTKYNLETHVNVTLSTNCSTRLEIQFKHTWKTIVSKSLETEPVSKATT